MLMSLFTFCCISLPISYLGAHLEPFPMGHVPRGPGSLALSWTVRLEVTLGFFCGGRTKQRFLAGREESAAQLLVLL